MLASIEKLFIHNWKEKNSCIFLSLLYGVHFLLNSTAVVQQLSRPGSSRFRRAPHQEVQEGVGSVREPSVVGLCRKGGAPLIGRREKIRERHIPGWGEWPPAKQDGARRRKVSKCGGRIPSCWDDGLTANSLKMKYLKGLERKKF